MKKLYGKSTASKSKRARLRRCMAELVAALPDDVPLAIEAPCRATAGLPALERATRAYQALARLQSSR
jgi:hypothetical protein